MPRLLIGHVTDQSAKIWVRGTSKSRFAFVDLFNSSKQRIASQVKGLEERHFYTGVLEFDGLTARRVYRCRVTFGSRSTTPLEERERPPDHEGRFRTFPGTGSKAALNFLFGSCNLHTLGKLNPANPAYRRLAQKAEETNADFMLHAGDQIYYDRPRYNRPPSIPAYRRSYLDAWDDSKQARRFLTRLPHYMILDDHEMRNDFHNDMEVKNGTVHTIRDFSLKVYREFQHIHNPHPFGNAELYYHFDFGPNHFFVLDTRSERWAKGDSVMIGSQQLERLLDWLETHRDELKFVVTSVPFVAEVRNTEDKWSSAPYRRQREVILEAITNRGIGGLVFLTGDMHHSYHAEMTLRRGQDEELKIHELMSSPINQLGKASRSRHATGQVFNLANGWTYSSQFATRGQEETFFNEHSNAVHVRVEGRQVDYSVFRTKKTRTVLRGSFRV